MGRTKWPFPDLPQSNECLQRGVSCLPPDTFCQIKSKFLRARKPREEERAALFLLRFLAAYRRFNRGDVDFFHRHHRLEGALGHCLVGIGNRARQHARRDLP